MAARVRPAMAAAGSFGLSKIGQIMVPVHDLETAAGFYRDVLGMQMIQKVPTMAFFDCGGVTLMVDVPETPELDHPGSIIYFRVDNIETAAKTLQSRGVRFDTEPHRVHRAETYDLWMAFFRDLDGSVLALMNEVPRK